MRSATIRLPGLGSRLREARNAAGLTQQRTADELGLTVRTYQKYEEGATEPTLHNLVSLAILFGQTTDALLGLESGGQDGE